jgi:hypothetical protein
MSTSSIRFEVPQTDSTSVKDKIIQFFAKHAHNIHPTITDEDRLKFAKKCYQTAEQMGHIAGTYYFDECIIALCKEMKANPDELTKAIENSIPVYMEVRVRKRKRIPIFSSRPGMQL